MAKGVCKSRRDCYSVPMNNTTPHTCSDEFGGWEPYFPYLTGPNSPTDEPMTNWERDLLKGRAFRSEGMRVTFFLADGTTRVIHNVREESYVHFVVKGAAGSGSPDLSTISVERINDEIVYIPGVLYWTSQAE